MIKVKFGIKLNHWDVGQVYGSPKNCNSIADAKAEVNNIINTLIKKMFTKVECGELIEIPKDYTAWYPDRPKEQILARMDGLVEDGEFYVLVYLI